MYRIALTTVCLSLGLVSGCALFQRDTGTNDQMQAQQDENNRTAFANNLDGLDRVYRDISKKLEMEEAKHQGLASSLTDKATQDPQFPLIEKQHDEIVEENADVTRRYEAVMSWAAGVKDHPSTEDVRKLAQEASSIQQDLAGVLTNYGRLQIEMTQLKARHY
jgi:hypothetical protein